MRKQTSLITTLFYTCIILSIITCATSLVSCNKMIMIGVASITLFIHAMIRYLCDTLYCDYGVDYNFSVISEIIFMLIPTLVIFATTDRFVANSDVRWPADMFISGIGFFVFNFIEYKVLDIVCSLSTTYGDIKHWYKYRGL